RLRGMAVTRLLAAALLGCITLQATAAEARRPDLSGFWMLTGTQSEDPVLKAKVAPGTVVLQDTGAPEYGPMEFGGLKLTPTAEAVAKAWRIEDDMTVANTCRIPSIVYAMQGPF